MNGFEARPRAPSRAALLRLATAVAPGSRPVNVRRLRGGISARTHAVDLVQPDGERLRLVVRRGPEAAPEHVGGDDRATRLYRTLELLERLELPAPRPVLLDRDGAILGETAVVMARAPGRGILLPRETESRLRQLAAVLAAIHRAPLDRHEIGFLPGPGYLLRGALAHTASEAGAAVHPDSAAVTATLARWQHRIRPRPPALVHGDFWTGNTLWRRGRLQAVVDWEDACIDSPAADVASCRLDIYLSSGAEAADRYLHLYEEAAGEQVEDCFFWDLAAATHAFPDPVRWLPAYYDFGLREVTPDLQRARLRAFIADALERAAAAEAELPAR